MLPERLSHSTRKSHKETQKAAREASRQPRVVPMTEVAALIALQRTQLHKTIVDRASLEISLSASYPQMRTKMTMIWIARAKRARQERPKASQRRRVPVLPQVNLIRRSQRDPRKILTVKQSMPLATTARRMK